MARRVYLAPDRIRMSRPGFDAAVAPIHNLSFSSEMAGIAGSVLGEVYFPPSESNGNGYNPRTAAIPLPPGSGVPLVWIWNSQPQIYPSAFLLRQMLAYVSADETQLIFEGRSSYPTHAGYLLYRNRT